MIGKGYTVKSAMLEMSMVAEGYYATKSAYKINQKNEAKTPIIDAVFNVLYDKKEAKDEFLKLTNTFEKETHAIRFKEIRDIRKEIRANLETMSDADEGLTVSSFRMTIGVLQRRSD